MKITSYFVKLVKNLIRKIRDILTNELPKKLPPNRLVDHNIELIPSIQPLSKVLHRLNQLKLSKLKKLFNELLEKWYIKQRKSPFRALAFFMTKKDGKIRMCIDYRVYNKITIKNNYLFLRIDDLLNRLNGS